MPGAVEVAAGKHLNTVQHRTWHSRKRAPGTAHQLHRPKTSHTPVRVKVVPEDPSYTPLNVVNPRFQRNEMGFIPLRMMAKESTSCDVRGAWRSAGGSEAKSHWRMNCE